MAEPTEQDREKARRISASVRGFAQHDEAVAQALADERQSRDEHWAKWKTALSVAVDIIMASEPGDSRAVSPLAVALAAFSVDVADEDGRIWKLIEDAAIRAKGEVK